MDQLTTIIGPHNVELCPTLIHLSLADSAYSILATPLQSVDDELKDEVRLTEVEG